MGIVIDDTLISNYEEKLKALTTADPNMRKVMQQHIREAIWKARAEVMNSIQFNNGDPRDTKRAVRNSVYEKILGGQLNIRKSNGRHGSSSVYMPPNKTMHGNRGGNRRPRSQRTEQINSGSPLDRGWILNILNVGTKTRVIGFRNTVKGNRGKYSSVVRRVHRGDISHTGNRGSISPRNWFLPAAEKAMNNAMQTLGEMIDIELNAIMNGDT